MMFYIHLSLRRYRNRNLRYGTTIGAKLERRIRNTFTLTALAMKDLNERRAASRVLIPFLRSYNHQQRLQRRFRNVHKRVLFIQRRFRNWKVLTDAKVRAMKAMWTAERNAIFMASKKKPGAPDKFLGALCAVPDETKAACFRRYLYYCKHRHALAFF